MQAFFLISACFRSASAATSSAFRFDSRFLTLAYTISWILRLNSNFAKISMNFFSISIRSPSGLLTSTKTSPASSLWFRPGSEKVCILQGRWFKSYFPDTMMRGWKAIKTKIISMHLNRCLAMHSIEAVSHMLCLLWSFLLVATWRDLQEPFFWSTTLPDTSKGESFFAESPSLLFQRWGLMWSLP